MSKIKKICFFTTRCDFARQPILEFYEKFFPKDVKLYLFYRKDGKNKLPTKRIAQIESNSSKAEIWKELRRFCREKDIDLVVNLSGMGEVSLTLFLATLLIQTKFFIYFHGDPKINLRNLSFLLTQFFAKKILSASKDVEERAKRILFFRRKNIFYLPHPVNTDLFKPCNKNQIRRKLKLSLNEKICIFVGRIELEKGSDILLKIIKKNPEKKFILLGNLKDKNYAKEKPKNVIIKQVPSQEISKYYAAADLCIFLTKRDGYSYIPRESMASGTPVILSDIPAFKPIITSAAFKVPLKVGEIQKRIDSFFSLSKKQRQELSKEGRKFIQRDSSRKVIGPRVISHFLD